MLRDESNTEYQVTEVERLRLRLQEAEDVLEAIRTGAVDALIVSGPDSDRVYTLTGTNQAYRILFETMNEGAAILSVDGTIFFCNTALSAMLKTPLQVILGGSIFRFVAEEHATSARALLERGLEQAQKREIALQPSKGNVVPCQISTSPFIVEDSSTICMIVTDLTERKLAENALRHSEQRFRAIFETVEDCIFLKDRSLRYIQVNPAFERLVGLPASEIVGKRHEDLFGEEAADYIKEMDLRALDGETLEDEHTKAIHGVARTFLAARTPLRESSDEIAGVLVVLHDITDRKRFERLPEKATHDYPSEAMRITMDQARITAKRASTILLTGESGSGKDYLARYIHDHSDRANGPYFSINCAAIAPELAESELFGHEKGAFTGAAGKKRGLLELAEGGTLLLNEIGELSLPLQAKLLSFLDTKKFTRVGGEKEISVGARLIAATNKDLGKAVETGRFRKDLFYRLDVLSMRVPPLRERIADIPILVQEMLAKLCDEMQIQEVPAIVPSAMDVIKKYDWPGNVRELRNVLERALILAQGNKISPPDLGLANTAESLSEAQACFSVSFPSDKSVNEMTQELKRFLVNEALHRSGGSRQEAAKLLGISRYSLKHYMKKLGYADE